MSTVSESAAIIKPFFSIRCTILLIADTLQATEAEDTGSDNALFGGLQVVTTERLGLNPALMAAGNSTGGVMGKMISLQTIAVAAASTNMSAEDQPKLFRFTLKHSLLLASAVGLLVMFYTYVLRIRF